MLKHGWKKSRGAGHQNRNAGQPPIPIPRTRTSPKIRARARAHSPIPYKTVINIPLALPPNPAKLADMQTATARDKIEQVLDSIRPALRSDGGDVEFIDFDEEDGVVQLRLVGACGTCPVSTMTLRQGIERRLMLAVPEVKGILAL